MKRLLLSFGAVLLAVGQPAQAGLPADLTAINIVIEPDGAMHQMAVAANSRVHEAFPQSFPFDETRIPHITILQGYVRTADLEKVFTAIRAALEGETPTAWKLKATQFDFTPWDTNAGRDLGLAGIAIESSEGLSRIQSKLVDAVAPFGQKNGTASAFYIPDDESGMDRQTAEYVESYVPKKSGKNFHPHLTVGIATKSFVKQVLNDKFESFSFSPAGVAVYQIGKFGTARKKLADIH